MTEPITREHLVDLILDWLQDNYLAPMWRTVVEQPALVKVIPGFLLQPTQMIFYFGRTHIGIEYVGPERLTQLPQGTHKLQVQAIDYSAGNASLLDEIIGFDYGGGIQLPLHGVNYNIVLPTRAAAAELLRLKWNWAAQDMTLGINSAGLMVPEGQFARLVNARFFDADEKGLKTRHIRWLDLIPLQHDDSASEYDECTVDLSVLADRARVDPLEPYPLPLDYRQGRLQSVNRFIELLGDRTLSEPQITAALSAPAYQFILASRFSAEAVHPQLLCEWPEPGRPAIQPDFFVVGTDGFADIVEFKLPELKSAPVVGRTNRETFSAEIHSYVAQTRVYQEYFHDPRNREYVKTKYGFEVCNPRRILVMGRRWQMDSYEWRSIAADYPNVAIMTYDDLIDGVVAQLYS